MGVQNENFEIKDRDYLVEQKKKELDQFASRLYKMKDTINRWDIYANGEQYKSEKAYINGVCKEMNTLVDKWFCMTKRMEYFIDNVEDLATIINEQSER